MSAFNTTFFPQYWFHTMTALVKFKLDSGELQVIFCLFQPVKGAFFFSKLQSRRRHSNSRILTFCTHSWSHSHALYTTQISSGENLCPAWFYLKMSPIFSRPNIMQQKRNILFLLRLICNEFWIPPSVLLTLFQSKKELSQSVHKF